MGGASTLSVYEEEPEKKVINFACRETMAVGLLMPVLVCLLQCCV